MYGPRVWWCIFRCYFSPGLMGQILHGSARTRQAIRRAIPHSQQSVQSVATRYSINPKTVAKWRKRTTVQDAPMGPAPASTVLTAEQEAIAIAFRRHTLLPLDDCLYAPQALRPASHDSAALARGLAPLFPASRHQPPAAERRRAAPAEKEMQGLPHGVAARRFGRSADRGRPPVLFVAIDFRQ
jgi:transposase-like protein